MAKKVYKYPFGNGDTINIHQDAVMVHSAYFEDMPTIWAQVDTNLPIVEMRMWIFGTGDIIPNGLRHVGTYIIEDLVWHIYH